MSIILHSDGLFGKMTGTVYGEQVKAGLEDVTRALVKRNVKPALTVAVERNSVVSRRQR